MMVMGVDQDMQRLPGQGKYQQQDQEQCYGVFMKTHFRQWNTYKDSGI